MGIGTGKVLATVRQGRTVVGWVKRFRPGGLVFEAAWDAPDDVPGTLNAVDLKMMREQLEQSTLTMKYS